jgi:hypothetical protein
MVVSIIIVPFGSPIAQSDIGKCVTKALQRME